MYVKKIEELSKYLLTNESPNDELCRFLNFAVFNYLQSRSVIMCQLTNDGNVTPVGSFGLSKEALKGIANTSLATETPMSAAVIRDTTVLVKSPAELFKRFPALKNASEIDTEWKSLITIPVHTFGVYGIKCMKQPELDPSHESFLRIIGQLAAFAVLKSRNSKVLKINNGVGLTIDSGQLTARQEQIKALMLRGMTNQQIASEIGYSDSLVRQETMEIYAKLKVSGRKELLENSGGGGEVVRFLVA